MDYEKSVNLNGDPAKAMTMVSHVLAQHNFRIVSADARELVAEGSGMNNNHHPIRGVSRIHVTTAGRSMTIAAEMGAMRRFWRGMALFIIGMALLFVVLFGVLSYAGAMHWRGKKPFGIWMYLLPLAPFVPWPVLLPLMRAGFRRRCVEALDNLLHNASMQP